MQGKKDRLIPMILALVFLLASCGQEAITPTPTTEASALATGTDAQVFSQFEDELEDLRRKLKIPGFSAAIVQDQELVWVNGFGYADLENQVEASPSTPYHLASLTKPFAAVIVMQLVEEGVLDLDDPVSKYGVHLDSPGVIRVRHLLTHTSEGQPGEEFYYNGWRYLYLDHVMQAVTGKSFRELLAERILKPLEMTDTAPNPMSQGEGFLTSFGIWLDPRNQRIYRQMARPYRLDASYNLVEGRYEEFFLPGAGLISTVVDMAKFYIALDQNVLVSQETKEQMFAPAVSTTGAELPHGLGWFAQTYKGTRLIWHYGWWPPCASAFILKVPDENMTFIILATTDNLSRPYRLGSGEFLPLDSAVGMAFYKTFVFEPQHGLSVPRVDWEAEVGDIVEQLRGSSNPGVQEILERELLSHHRLYSSVGRMDVSDRLKTVHRRVYAPSRLENYSALQGVGNPPAEFEVPMTMVHRLAILGGVLMLPLGFVLWWVRRRKKGKNKGGLSDITRHWSPDQAQNGSPVQAGD